MIKTNKKKWPFLQSTGQRYPSWFIKAKWKLLLHRQQKEVTAHPLHDHISEKPFHPSHSDLKPRPLPSNNPLFSPLLNRDKLRAAIKCTNFRLLSKPSCRLKHYRTKKPKHGRFRGRARSGLGDHFLPEELPEKNKIKQIKP